MGIEVAIQLDRQRIGILIRLDLHIGAAVVITAIRAGSLDGQSFAQFSMDSGIAIALEVQALVRQFCFHTIADGLQIADSGPILQHGAVCRNGGDIHRLILCRIIESALYIGNLLTAIGQSIGGQLYLAICAAVLGRNGNALAVNYGHSTSRRILESSTGHVFQFLAQAKGNGFASGICRSGQIAVCRLQLDGAAQILLHHIACIVADTKAATRFLAIDNGIGHLLELVFCSRPAADNAVGLPILIVQASEIVTGFRIVIVAKSTICNGLIAQFGRPGGNRSEARQLFGQLQGELAIVPILRCNDTNIVVIISCELICIRNTAGDLYILVQQDCGLAYITTVIHAVAQRSKSLLRVLITIDRVREAWRRIALLLQILGSAIILVQGSILVSQSHAEGTVTAVEFNIVATLARDMEIAIIAIICTLGRILLSKVHLIIHLHSDHAVIIDICSQVI